MSDPDRRCDGCQVLFKDKEVFEKNGDVYCNVCYNGIFCAGCEKPVLSYVLALGVYWHHTCLRCAGCDNAFEGTMSTVFISTDGKAICKVCKSAGWY